MRRASAVLLVLILAVPAPAARRRAVHIPELPPGASTPAGWLLANAHVLHSTGYVPSSDDLEPLRTLVAEARVVGLGDGTHGTREFSTVKLRIIDFLVRELGFDVVAIEAPFPVMNRINEYVRSGTGDPRAILHDAATRLSYWFWYTEEMLEVIEWMRAYNAQRGERPRVEIVGVDVYDDVTAVADVLAYLRPIDPIYAAEVEGAYACVVAGERSQSCQSGVSRVVATLTAREREYIPYSSARAYHDALRNASVILAGSRDEVMARGTLWAREHRGSSGKVFFWAHNEHVSEDNHVTDAGRILAGVLGRGYLTIATMSGPGTFRGWQYNPTLRVREPVVRELPPIAPGSYESFFRQAGGVAILVPTQGDVPQWLHGPASYRWGGSDGTADRRTVFLPRHWDAVVYVDQTTPVTNLR